MSTTPIDDGGPAFPAPDLGAHDFGDRSAYPGMPLRDYFAAHVRPPVHISREWGEVMVRPYPKAEDGLSDAAFGPEVIAWWQDVDAAWRYAQADAMLRARKVGT